MIGNDRTFILKSVLTSLKFRRRIKAAASGFIPGCELSKPKGMADLCLLVKGSGRCPKTPFLLMQTTLLITTKLFRKAIPNFISKLKYKMSQTNEQVLALTKKIEELFLKGKITSKHISTIEEIIDTAEKPNGSQVVNMFISKKFKSCKKDEIFADTYERYDTDRYPDNDPRYVCRLTVHKHDDVFVCRGKTKKEALDKACDKFIAVYHKDMPSNLLDMHVESAIAMNAESAVADMSMSRAHDTATVSGSVPLAVAHEEEVLSLDEFIKFSTDPAFRPSELMDRWVTLDQFEWSESKLGSESGATSVRTYDLPVALTANTAVLCDSQSLSTVRLNRLMKTGMEIRIDCPANPLATGQLFAKWFYDARMDRDINWRTCNAYTMSHGKFGKIRPGGKESAEFRIGFNNRGAAVSNQTNDYDNESALYLGRLAMCVNGPLRVAVGANNRAVVRVMFRFVDMSMHGRKPGNMLITPKLTKAWNPEGPIADVVNSSVAAPIVNTLHDVDAMIGAVRPTENQDKPADPFSKVVVIPSYMNSLSYGTRITTNNNSLRMRAGAAKPSALSNEGCGKFKEIITDNALYRTVEWDINMPAGQVLFKVPIEPFHDQVKIGTDGGMYPSISCPGASGGTGLAIPPLDVLASNFMYSTGTLKYGVEVLGTEKHNGAIKICTIPLINVAELNEKDLGIYALNDVKGETITLGQLNTSATVESDYHNTNPVFGIRSGDKFSTTERRSMGVLVVIVQNPLDTSVASTTVDVNLYKCGAADFEVIGSKASRLVPAFDSADGTNPAKFMTATSGNTDFYFQRSTQIDFGTIEKVGKIKVPVMQTSSVFDSPEVFKRRFGTNASWTTAQILVRSPGGKALERRLAIASQDVAKYYRVHALSPVKQYQSIRFTRCVMFPFNGGLVAIPIVAQFRETSNGQFETPSANYYTGYTDALNAYFKAETADRTTKLNALAEYMVNTEFKSDWISVIANQSGATIILEEKTPTVDGYFPPPDAVAKGAEGPDPNSGAQEIVIPTLGFPTKNFGGKIYDEQIDNAKDIMRQPRYVTSVNWTPSKDPMWPYASFAFRARHLQPPPNIDDIVNHACRWPKQMILALGYTYVSGGIDWQILFPKVDNMTAWIQYRPYDKPANNKSVEMYTGTTGPIFLNGPNTNVANLGINSHISETTPYLNENIRNVLMRMPVDESGKCSLKDKGMQQCFDLGQVTVGFINHSNNTDNSTYHIVIMSSWADDVEMSGYRGFPPMRFVSDANAEGPDWAPSAKKRNKKAHAENGNTVLTKMMSGFTSNAVGDVLKSDAFTQQIDTLKEEIANSIGEDKNKAMEILSEHMQKLIATLQAASKETLMNRLGEIIVGQAVHFFINPTVKTAIVCIVSTIAQAGFFCTKTLQRLVATLTGFFSPEEPEEGTVTKQAEGPETGFKPILKGIIATLVSGICAQIGWNHPALVHVDWLKKLSFAVPSFTGMAVSIYKFVDVIFPVMEYIYNYLVELKVRYVDGAFEYSLIKNENFLASWFHEVDELCSQKSERLYDSVEFHNRVLCAYELAKAIEKKMLVKTMTGSHVITHKIKAIVELKLKLNNEGFKAVVRKEPYVMWQYGEAGIGKSHFTAIIEAELISRNQIDVPGDVTLVAQPTSQYLNRVHGQPVLRLDDFAAVSSEQHISTQLSYLFEGCTSAVWCPNQASLNDKNRLYAPHFMAILANSALPAGLAVADKPALIRRRNVTMHYVKNQAHFDAMSETDKKEVEDLFATGKKLGHLPDKFKITPESLYNHVRVCFETIPEGYPLSPPKVRVIDNKTLFTIEEAIEILDEDYKEFAAAADRSFKMRLEHHYKAKRMAMPDFAALLGEEADPALGLSIRNLLAHHDGDGVLTESTRQALKQCHFVGHEKIKHIFDKYYNVSTETKTAESKLTPTGSKELFIAQYGSQKRQEEVRKILDGLGSVGKIKYDRHYEIEVDGTIYPLSYYVLKYSKCTHLTDNPKRDLDHLLNPDFACTHDCLLEPAHKPEILEACIVQIDDDPSSWVSRVNKFLAEVPQTLRDFINRAKRGFKAIIDKVLSSIKIMGVSLKQFLCDHWKKIAGVIGSMAAIIFMRRNPTTPGATYIIQTTDKAMDLASDGYAAIANGVASAVGSVKQFKWSKTGNAEAYNPTIRVVTKTVKTAAKAPVSKVAENAVGGRDITMFKRMWRRLVCTMNDTFVKAGGAQTMEFPLLALGGHDCCIVLHSWEMILRYADNVRLEVHRVGKESICRDIDMETVTYAPFQHYSPSGEYKKIGNFVIVTFPSWFPPAKSVIRTRAKCGKQPCLDSCERIVKSSIFQSANTNNHSGIATLVLPPQEDADGDVVMTVIRGLPYDNPDEEYVVNPVYVGSLETSSRTYYSDNLAYPAHGRGYCGGLLVDEGSQTVVGFHYCGGDGIGVAERVTTEMFRPAEYEYEEPEMGDIDDSFDIIPGVIQPAGISSVKKHQPSKSKIAESAIHGAVKITTGRAALCPRDMELLGHGLESPLYNGVLKHGIPPSDFDIYALNEAMHDYKSVILAIKPKMRDDKGNVRQPKIAEAIFGLEGVYNSMDMSTSLGYGWDKYKSGGKRMIADIDTRTIHPELQKRLADAISKLKQGIVPYVIAEDCLKDETLPEEKRYRTRIISTLPFEYQILLRLYTMEFTNSHQADNFNSEHAIGINVDSDEVHLLVSSLHNRNIVAGDFSNFGPGASAQVAKECLNLIVEWYRLHGASEAFCYECKTLLQILVCTPHLAYDKIYRTVCGIISGSAITVVLNTMIHSVYMRLAAIGLGVNMEQYRRCVRLYTYGDDGIAGVTDEIIDKFNMKTLQQYFMTKQIKYTNPDKTDEIVKTVKLITTDTETGTSFLKHSFKLVGGKYIACLKKESIENQINWISIKGDKTENTVVNVQNALRQAYMHGKMYYDELEKKCAEAFAHKGKRPFLETFEGETLSRTLRGLSTY